QAEKDGVLAERVALRPDIPPRLFQELLLKATEVVQQRLFALADPETQIEIERVLAKVSSEVGTRSGLRDYSAAQQAVAALLQDGKLNEARVAEFATTGRFEDTAASLALLCPVPIHPATPPITRPPPHPLPPPSH